MIQPVITLTTDFGLSDHYAGTMKGVILGIAPAAQIVDITHEVAPFEILDGAYTIAQAYRYFPKRTIHVIVVDPGVGTERRPILAEAAGQYFIAPDNGVLTMIYEREKHKVRVIQNERFFLKNRSTTFHGRDIFAPSAAWLARGTRPSMFGNLINGYAQLGLLKPQRMGKRIWSGTVLKADRFGNLITNFPIADFADIRGRAFEMQVGLRLVDRLCSNYAQAAPGELFAIVGSSGYIEVSVNQGSAAKQLGAGAGAPVELTLY
jgi:S-adenosyl-L-methionine hydrolase (adenosine-forming)